MRCITISPLTNWLKGVSVSDSILLRAGDTRKTWHLVLDTGSQRLYIPVHGRPAEERIKTEYYLKCVDVERQIDPDNGIDRFRLELPKNQEPSCDHALVFFCNHDLSRVKQWSKMSIAGISAANRLYMPVDGDGPTPDSLFILKKGERISINRVNIVAAQKTGCPPWSKKNRKWSKSDEYRFVSKGFLWRSYDRLERRQMSYTLMYNGVTLEPVGPEVTPDGWVDVRWPKGGLLAAAKSPAQLESGRELLEENACGALSDVLRALFWLRGRPEAANLKLAAAAVRDAEHKAGAGTWTRRQLAALEQAAGVVETLALASKPPLNMDWSSLEEHTDKIATEAMKTITATLLASGFSDPAAWSWLSPDVFPEGERLCGN